MNRILFLSEALYRVNAEEIKKMLENIGFESSACNFFGDTALSIGNNNPSVLFPEVKFFLESRGALLYIYDSKTFDREKVVNYRKEGLL